MQPHRRVSAVRLRIAWEQVMTGAISGSVVDAQTLSPVGGVKISICKPDIEGTGMEDVSDAAGGFSFEGLEAGVWRIVCRPPNSSPVELYANVFENAVTTIEIETPAELSRDGEIIGRVIDAATGNAIAGAIILIVGGPHAVPDIAPVSDRSGSFSLSGLGAGDWRLQARSEDGRRAHADVVIGPGERSTATIRIGID
ncbi:MAG: carboxypeptidase regulatory-like domain-containing protein [Parvularculaceae bacterium]|nr:carboxypeptidase regulatory-like domain-containing protein [Parvularculaceae bacterium]